MTQLIMSVLELSKGSIWNPAPHLPPYLVAPPGDPWPTATAYVVFTDTAGNQIGQIDATSVTPDQITFLADSADVDSIPAGANFEIFLNTTDGLRKIRYGRVIRREVTFPDSPPAQQSTVALRYTDTFPTLGLRSNWQAIAGQTRVHDNSLLSLPNSVGPAFDALFYQSAIRWDAPLNGDSARVHVTVIDPSPISLLSKTTIILCADQRLTSFLACQFESSTGTNHLRIGTGNSPFAFTDQVTAVTHDVTNGDDYTIAYDELTKKLFIYQGTDTTPLLSWTDSLDVMPHGPGYRYLGMAFQASLTPLGPGVQVTGWQAKDDV